MGRVRYAFAVALLSLPAGCSSGSRAMDDMSIGSAQDMSGIDVDLAGTDAGGGASDMTTDMKTTHPPLMFGAPTALTTTEAIPRDIFSGDFNKDGKVDLFVVTGSIIASSSAGFVDALAGVGDGSFAYQAGNGFTVAKGGFANVADVDNNGSTDGVFYYTTTNMMTHVTSYFFGDAPSNGDGTFATASFMPAPTSFGQKLYAADLNNDHAIDVVTIKTDNSSNPTGFSVFKNDGANNMTRTDYTTPTYPAPVSGLVVADVTGDGKPDVFYAAQNQAIVVAGNGDGTFAATPTMFATALGNNLSVAVGDLNADNKPDLIAGEDNGNMTVVLSQATGGFLSPNTITGTGMTKFVAAGDFDGDGLNDLVTCDGTSLRFYVNLGNGFAVPNTISQTCGPMAVADFNGDHLADVATVSPTPSTAVLLNLTH